MGLIDFPNPAEWVESAKNASFERDEIRQVASAAYSFWISTCWNLGQRKWFTPLADAATAMYLSLSSMQKQGKLWLTVPKALLDPNNLSRFQTEAPPK